LWVWYGLASKTDDIAYDPMVIKLGNSNHK
jgi:hypothetical protein